jgi:AbrB family transcriptional regulator, transcriptional pleiotropic regulator of transition state genes
MTATVRSGVERKIDALGRIVIPSEMRQTLGLTEGDVVDVEMQNGIITLHPLQANCPLCEQPVRAVDRTRKP